MTTSSGSDACTWPRAARSSSALSLGGLLAGWASARFTYFASLPFIAAAIVAFLRFDEPRLHRHAEPIALRRHVGLMFTP